MRFCEKITTSLGKLLQLFLAAVLFVATATIGPVRAQSHYPSRPITFVVPIVPGGAMDV